MKRKILIASFLKPVNDIRSYEKIALSLSSNSSYKIYCTGYPSNIELSDNNVEILPLSSFKKRGLSRIWARWKVFNIYIKVKPQLIIVNSPDLIVLTCVYKILFGGHIIYDIRENYFKNLWYQNNYQWGIKHVLALLVRIKELITSPLFNHFLLAEKVYATQLKFVGNRFTILENTSLASKKTIVPTELGGLPNVIISGTIAYEYGILEAINFVKIISTREPKTKLIIIGHCPNNLLYNKLSEMSKRESFIDLKLSKNPIPHLVIEQEILKANIGLLPYLPNESTQGKWPTKLYEYMAYNLPFIIQENIIWNPFVLTHNAGVSFDFRSIEKMQVLDLWNLLNNKEFYTKPIADSIYWKTQEKQLLSVVESLI